MSNKRHLYLPTETDQKLKELAEMDGRTVSGWLRHVIETIHAKRTQGKTNAD